MTWYGFDFTLPTLSMPTGITLPGSAHMERFTKRCILMYAVLAVICALLTLVAVFDSPVYMLTVPVFMLMVYLMTRHLRTRMLTDMLNEFTVTQLTTGQDDSYVYTAVKRVSAEVVNMNRSIYVAVFLGVMLTLAGDRWGFISITVGCLGYACIAGLQVYRVSLTAAKEVVNVHLVDLEAELNIIRGNIKTTP